MKDIVLQAGAIAMVAMVSASQPVFADVNVNFINAQVAVKDAQTISINNADVSGYGVFQLDVKYNPKTLSFEISRALQTSAPISGASRTCKFTVGGYGATATVDVVTNPANSTIDLVYTTITGYYIVPPYDIYFSQGANRFVLLQYGSGLGSDSQANSATLLSGYDDIGGSTNRTSTTLRVSGLPTWFDSSKQFTIYHGRYGNPC